MPREGSVISFSVGPSESMSSVSTHVRKNTTPVRAPEAQREPASPVHPSATEKPRPPELERSASPPPALEMDFTKWYLSMMHTMMGFLSAAVFLPHGKYASSLPLHESLRRLQLLREVRVKPLEGGGELPGGQPPCEGGGERHLEGVPVPVAQGLRHALSMMDRLHQQQVDKEERWSEKWSDSHSRMAQAFASSTTIIRERLTQDLRKIEIASRKWERVVERMLESQRADLDGQVKRMAQRWRRFLEQHRRARGAAAAPEMYQAQLGLLEGVEESLRSALRGRALGGGSGGHSFMAVVDHFVRRHPRAGGGGGSRHQEAHLETVLAKTLALEQQMVANRHQRHRLWVDTQNDQPGDQVQRLGTLDGEYVEMDKELRVLNTVQQDLQHHRMKRVRRSLARSDPRDSPEDQRWKKMAWRFAEPILNLENQVHRFASLSQRLERSVHEVRDEVSASAVGSVKSCVQRMVQRLWSELRQHLRGGAPAPLDPGLQQRLEHEIALLGQGHDIEPLLRHHRELWRLKRHTAAAACRSRAIDQLDSLVRGEKSVVRRMAQVEACANNNNNDDQRATGTDLDGAPRGSGCGDHGAGRGGGAASAAVLRFATEASATTASSSP